ncbi:histidine phosphatase family protein [Shimia biformata]|uniref:histidine phosphatase family protein n=1 Tax=Shimia biformata TaxID=1294299 RepID=UPI001950ADD9|nr:histidine phosphatase family protein [Shimia biformata]
MTRLFLVRHGPTHARAMVGWSDIPADLSDHAAIARLDAFLPEDALVVSSDLVRATATADAIQGARDRLPHDPALREINFGRWELRTFNEIEAEDPDHIRAYWETPGDVAAPEGESWHQTHNRVSGAVDRLIRAHPGRALVVVCHFGAILTQVQRAAGLDNTQAFAHRIDNLSVTEIAITPDGWQVGRINHIP